MVNYLEKVNEVVFLNVGLEKIESKENNTLIPWTSLKIPFTEKKPF